MIHFVTHFDNTYRAQGMCMLDSLRRHAGERHIQHTVWCDQEFGYGAAGHDASLRGPRDLRSFSRIEHLRQSRSKSAWFWSLEPAVVDHFLSVLQDGDILVYVDADQFFFADPIPTIRKVLPGVDDIPLSCGPAIIALSPHYFPAGKEKPYVGRFNFGIGCFRACDESRQIVSEWLDQVIEQCDEVRNDQMYLDQWPDKLGNRLAEIHPGINCGPWSLPEVHANHVLYRPVVGANGKIVRCGEQWPLISAHMHEFRRGLGRNQIILKGESWNRTNYDLHPSTIASVYEVYERELSKFL